MVQLLLFEKDSLLQLARSSFPYGFSRLLLHRFLLVRDSKICSVFLGFLTLEVAMGFLNKFCEGKGGVLPTSP